MYPASHKKHTVSSKPSLRAPETHDICRLATGLPWWLSGKESACSAGDMGSIPGSGRSPGEGNGNPLRYSCLENPIDRGAWLATVHEVAKSQTQLKNNNKSRILERGEGPRCYTGFLQPQQFYQNTAASRVRKDWGGTGKSLGGWLQQRGHRTGWRTHTCTCLSGYCRLLVFLLLPQFWAGIVPHVVPVCHMPARRPQPQSYASALATAVGSGCPPLALLTQPWAG